ncbi:DUF4191 domain-containing protein [Microbacterium kribbense]|uniref:DUF4191 domain-containing protein n=1 Tax=Microbacterium kribbense TaxID=433645 RepID=A0ABP7GPY8_9MICO
MAARSSQTEKKPNFFVQLKSLFTFTKDVFGWLPWALGGILLAGIWVGILIGFLLPPLELWSIVLWGFTGLLFGILAALMTMTRLSTKAMYQKIEGRPGAVGHVLSTSLGRSWQAGDTPVGVNPKTQEAVYRAVGRGGVVIVGEGAHGRLTRLVNEERAKVTRVASGVPVTVLYVGHGEKDVAISDLAKTVKKLPRAINRATQAAVIKRIDSVSQSLASLPIPKGIDPMRARAPRPR